MAGWAAAVGLVGRRGQQLRAEASERRVDCKPLEHLVRTQGDLQGARRIRGILRPRKDPSLAQSVRDRSRQL
eukprot:195001-Hanusia_phi.AAC.1